MNSNLPGNDKSGLEKESLSGSEMTLIDHLTELRKRLIICILGITGGFLISFYFAEDLFYYLSLPLVNVLPEENRKLVFTTLTEVFVVYIKVSLFAGLIVSSPVIFHQTWKFIAPGLYKHEKRYLIPFVIISTMLFIIGASFGYFEVFPWGFKFFIGMSGENITPMITLKDYLKFSTWMLIAFGLIFEMPVVCLFLAKIGIVTPAILRKNRKYAVLIILIVAAILTPPDVISQLMMAIPMIILYEISIWVAILFSSKHKLGNEVIIG